MEQGQRQASETGWAHLETLPPQGLARLHMLLTGYIVHRRADILRRIEDDYRVRVEGVLEADRLRRWVHKLLLDRSRSGEARIEYTAPFRIPDVEAIILSFFAGCTDCLIEVDRGRVLVYYEGEEKTLYNEPTDLFTLSVEYTLTPEHPVATVENELTLPLEELEVELPDLEPVPPEEVPPELKGEEWEGLEAYRVRKGADDTPYCLEAIACLEAGDTTYVLIDPHDSYTLSWIWRKGGRIRSPLLEELNRGIGGQAKYEIDRIYHVYPAEVDAGAPGDSIVHLSLYWSKRVRRAEDEVEVATLTWRILTTLQRLGLLKA